MSLDNFRRTLPANKMVFDTRRDMRLVDLDPRNAIRERQTAASNGPSLGPQTP